MATSILPSTKILQFAVLRTSCSVGNKNWKAARVQALKGNQSPLGSLHEEDDYWTDDDISVVPVGQDSSTWMNDAYVDLSIKSYR